MIKQVRIPTSFTIPSIYPKDYRDQMQASYAAQVAEAERDLDEALSQGYRILSQYTTETDTVNSVYFVLWRDDQEQLQQRRAETVGGAIEFAVEGVYPEIYLKHHRVEVGDDIAFSDPDEFLAWAEMALEAAREYARWSGPPQRSQTATEAAQAQPAGDDLAAQLQPAQLSTSTEPSSERYNAATTAMLIEIAEQTILDGDVPSLTEFDWYPPHPLRKCAHWEAGYKVGREEGAKLAQQTNRKYGEAFDMYEHDDWIEAAQKRHEALMANVIWGVAFYEGATEAYEDWHPWDDDQDEDLDQEDCEAHDQDEGEAHDQEDEEGPNG